MYFKGRVLLAGLVLLMLMPVAFADGWKVKGALGQTVQYDDNIAMRVDANPAFGYLLSPSFGADWSTSNMSAGITGSGDIRRYNDRRWNCEGFSLRANQQYQTRLQVFSLSGSYRRNCSSSSQISDDGIIRPNSKEETYSITPAWSWQWSALDKFSISPGYSKTSYSTTGPEGGSETSLLDFQGNETYSLNVSESHTWTRRLSSTGSLFFSRLEFGNSLKQSVFGFQVSSQYAITRKWSINAGGGLRWVKSPSGSQSFGDNDNGSLLRTEIANLALNYKDRKANYSLTYSRSVSPSALGQLSKYNSVGMSYSYQITRKLDFNISGDFSKNESIGENEFQTNSERTFYSGSARLTWNFAREWQLSASYRYRRQDYANSGDGQEEAGGTSNAVMFSLNYNWNGMRTSY